MIPLVQKMKIVGAESRRLAKIIGNQDPKRSRELFDESFADVLVEIEDGLMDRVPVSDEGMLGLIRLNRAAIALDEAISLNYDNKDLIDIADDDWLRLPNNARIAALKFLFEGIKTAVRPAFEG